MQIRLRRRLSIDCRASKPGRHIPQATYAHQKLSETASDLPWSLLFFLRNSSSSDSFPETASCVHVYCPCYPRCNTLMAMSNDSNQPPQQRLLRYREPKSFSFLWFHRKLIQIYLLGNSAQQSNVTLTNNEWTLFCGLLTFHRTSLIPIWRTAIVE